MTDKRVISQSLAATLALFEAQKDNAPNRVEVSPSREPLLEDLGLVGYNAKPQTKKHNRTHNRLKNKMAKQSRKRNRK